jgi:hypothetical protein
LLHLGVEIAIGGCNDAHVHDDGVGAANPFELPFLQRTQELRLEFERQLADLVEEKGPAMSKLETAPPLPVGAGEGPPLVAEERRS